MGTDTLSRSSSVDGSSSLNGSGETRAPRPESPIGKAPPAPGACRERLAQLAWARQPVASRLKILKRARHRLASMVSEIAAAISPQLSRTAADTMVAELLPLLEAIRFLERQAPHLLSSRRLGRRGLPFWLSGVDAEIHRVPYGRVLVIGPANYPLFLPGVQVFQALAAGNAVVWKPGLGGAPVARLVADVLHRAGLPSGLLEITDDTVVAAEEAVSSRPDKVFFTGSASAGRHILRALAETATPCVAELSGNDAVIVLPSADLDRVIAALCFGMRLNGSATCMAPRRVLLVDLPPARQRDFIERLQDAMAQIAPVTVVASTRRQLTNLVADAERHGVTVIGDPSAEALRPVLLLNGTPQLQIAQTDIFAPVLTLIDVQGTAGVLDAQAACPYALTASIFGDEEASRALAAHLTAGTVIINDLIVPTADPRIPFGGRRGSGFGVTRGREGLLEMAAVKVVSTRRSRSGRHFEPTGAPHATLFAHLIATAHAGGLLQRWTSLKHTLKAAMELKKK